MNDPFERLPAEILLIIIKLVPDSSSLLHLVQASIFVAVFLEITLARLSGL
jgi:hypothetical protein